MLTFLFWNLNRKNLLTSVVRLVNLHHVDILMLAESAIEPTELLSVVDSVTNSPVHFSPGVLCQKVHIYMRFPGEYAQPIDESNRWSMRRVTLPERAEFLLVVAHLVDKSRHSNESQAGETTIIAKHIRDAEALRGHRRTIFVGDLNMNPFESGMVMACGLHAVMARTVANKGSRTVQEEEYPFFYNPMWSHFGDSNGRPSGTFYYTSAEQVAYFWHMFDQLLVRPDLLPVFYDEDVQILTDDGQVQLITG